MCLWGTKYLFGIQNNSNDSKQLLKFYGLIVPLYFMFMRLLCIKSLTIYSSYVEDLFLKQNTHRRQK